MTLILFMIFSIVAHHRRSGQVFTQDQEEMILIGAFGFFWFGMFPNFKSDYCTVVGSTFRKAKVVPLAGPFAYDSLGGPRKS